MAQMGPASTTQPNRHKGPKSQSKKEIWQETSNRKRKGLIISIQGTIGTTSSGTHELLEVPSYVTNLQGNDGLDNKPSKAASLQSYK